MKRLLLLLILILFLYGCTSQKDAVSGSAALVETKLVRLEKTDTVLNYMGVVNSDSLKKYSFKSGGILKTAHVQSGQAVNEGDILLELDKSDIQFQVDVAKKQAEAAYSQYEKALMGSQVEDINSARLDVEKAQAAYDFALKSFNDTKLLYDEGAVSLSSFKESELKLNIQEKELSQSKEVLSKAETGTRKEDISSAKSDYEMSKTNYEASLKIFDEATLFCDVKGYVAEILYKEGELIPQGYPAILIQSESQVVTIGVTQQDVEKINVGTLALITLNNTDYSGKITNINQTPNEYTRTFSVDIKIEANKKFYIGSICEVSLITGQDEGIWLEIPYILNDGENYVYTVEDAKASRKNIEVISIRDDKALVKGLSDNDEIIINGTDKIKDGYLVEAR